MNPISLHLLWTKLHKRLQEAVELERSRLGQEQTQSVQEYLDHNEFGLAREQLIYALADLDLEPLSRTSDLLSETAELMGSSV